MHTILVVEDNTDLAFGLSAALRIEGYFPIVAHDGVTGLEKARSDKPDLIILDLMLPRLSGYEVLKQLRSRDSETPVIILSAQGEEADKVIGFRLGADDYVTKPFGRLELIARVEAMLRRRRTEAGADAGMVVHRFGDVVVDTASRTVTRGGVRVALAPREYDLLLALLSRRGAVASRLQLLHEVWGHKGAVLTRTVDMHVAELRRKLEHQPARPRHIVTVRKAGYRIET